MLAPTSEHRRLNRKQENVDEEVTCNGYRRRRGRQLPGEVQQGSIKVGEANEQAMAGMARLGALDAINIATKAAPGKVTELQLDEESGYLIWEVTELGQDGQEVQLKLDAGNGRLLAAEVGDHQEDRGDKDHEDRGEGKHSSWKFWEDNDRDERGGDRD